MKRKASNNYLWVLRCSAEDEEYCRLAEEHVQLIKRYLEMFSTLTQDQQNALGEYWAVVHAMNHRLLKLACSRRCRFHLFRRRNK